MLKTVKNINNFVKNLKQPSRIVLNFTELIIKLYIIVKFYY